MSPVRRHTVRNSVLAAAVAVLGAFACSFSAPTLDEYAQEPGAVGGSGGTGATGGTDGIAGEPGEPQAGGATAGIGSEASGGEAGAMAGSDAGTAVHFTGEQFIITAQLPPAEDFTVEMWVKTTMTTASYAWNDGAVLFNADRLGVFNDFGIGLIGDRFGLGTGNPDMSVLSETPINSGSWMHVAGTRQMSTGAITVFVNGQLEATLLTGNTGPLDEAELGQIGGMWINGTLYSAFDGTVDELRVWNVVRSEQEIADTRYARLNGDEPGLVSYWRFDDGTGLVASDSSTSENHATLGVGDPDMAPEWVSDPLPPAP